MKELSKKSFELKGYGFFYLKTLTEENEIITGGSFLFNHKQILTITFSKDGWTDDAGFFYRFKLIDGALYTKWIVIGK